MAGDSTKTRILRVSYSETWKTIVSKRDLVYSKSEKNIKSLYYLEMSPNFPIQNYKIIYLKQNSAYFQSDFKKSGKYRLTSEKQMLIIRLTSEKQMLIIFQ